MLLTKILVAIQLLSYPYVLTNPISPSKKLVKRSLGHDLEDVTHIGEVSAARKLESDGKDDKLSYSKSISKKEEPGASNESDGKSINIDDLSETELIEALNNVLRQHKRPEDMNFHEAYDSLHGKLSDKSAALLQELYYHSSSQPLEVSIKKLKQLLDGCTEDQSKMVWSFVENYTTSIIGTQLFELFQSAENAQIIFKEKLENDSEKDIADRIWEVIKLVKGVQGKSVEKNMEYLKSKSKEYLKNDQIGDPFDDKQSYEDLTQLEEILGHYGKQAIYEIIDLNSVEESHNAIKKILFICPFQYQKEAFWKFVQKWNNTLFLDFLGSFLDSAKNEASMGKYSDFDKGIIKSLHSRAQELTETPREAFNLAERNYKIFELMTSRLDPLIRATLFKYLDELAREKMEAFNAAMAAKYPEEGTDALHDARELIDEEVSKHQLNGSPKKSSEDHKSHSNNYDSHISE